MSDHKESPYADGLEADLGHEIDLEFGAEADGMRSKSTGSFPRVRGSAADVVRTLPVAEPTRSDLEMYLASNQHMIEQQRLNIQRAESDHEIGRVKLIDRYRIQMEDLQHDADSALRAFDAEHDTKIADSRKLLQILLDVNGGAR